jgi:hypothetical protein
MYHFTAWHLNIWQPKWTPRFYCFIYTSILIHYYTHTAALYRHNIYTMPCNNRLYKGLPVINYVTSIHNKKLPEGDVL